MEISPLATLAGTFGTWVILLYLLIQERSVSKSLRDRIDALTDRVMSRNDELAAQITGTSNLAAQKAETRAYDQDKQLDTWRGKAPPQYPDKPVDQK